MNIHVTPPFGIIHASAAAAIALIYITLSSLIKEPNRQKFNAILVSGFSPITHQMH